MKRKALVLIVACLLSLVTGPVQAAEPEPNFTVAMAIDWLLDLIGPVQPSTTEPAPEEPAPPTSIPLSTDSTENADTEPDPEVGPGLDPWG